MIIKKKQIVTATLVLALGAAVMINWYISKPGVKSTLDNVTTTKSEQTTNLGEAQYVSATTAKESITDFKIKRDAAHDEAKETLNTIIKDSKSSETAVSGATDALKKLSEAIKDEADIENLVSAKISEECLVIIDNNTCRVILNKKSINNNVSLQIKELVINQTKIPAENITIVTINN